MSALRNTPVYDYCKMNIKALQWMELTIQMKLWVHGECGRTQTRTRTAMYDSMIVISHVNSDWELYFFHLQPRWNFEKNGKLFWMPDVSHVFQTLFLPPSHCPKPKIFCSKIYKKTKAKNALINKSSIWSNCFIYYLKR